MPKARNVDTFLLAVVDDEKGIFSIEGPMVDDRPWIAVVSKAQSQNRHIRCFNAGDNIAKAEGSIIREFSWRRVAAGSIVSRHLD